MKSIDFKSLLIGILGTALELDEQFQLDAFCFSDRIIAVRLTFTIFLQPIDIRYNNQLISFRDSKF